MQFLVLGYDGADEEAPGRRAAAREQHLAGSVRMYAAGQWLDSGALLDEAGTMIGSFIVCAYPSRQVLESQWLDQEPYIVGDVWKKVEIHPIQLSPRACSTRTAPQQHHPS